MKNGTKGASMIIIMVAIVYVSQYWDYIVIFLGGRCLVLASFS